MNIKFCEIIRENIYIELRVILFRKELISMSIKSKIFVIGTIMILSILCISVLVYATSEKLYKQTPKGTFVYREIEFKGI